MKNGALLIPVVLGWLAVWWMLPREKGRSRILGALMALGALLALQVTFLPPVVNLPPVDNFVRNSLFYLFSGTAILSGGLMITDRNPVFAALWFALSTLAVCGLFLLNSAPFLSAATIIVYAGAIVVTFLFVIMLAQQSGASNYDHHAVQPVMASVMSFVLLGALLFALQEWGGIDGKAADEVKAGQFVAQDAKVRANIFSRPPSSNPDEIGSMRVLGRSLFSDYLYFVELVGTVLLIATIGAIAIAPRRSQGTL
ncbi:MAG: NADH-quinone oxidoreductase subunit J [Planctomycetota bacterium]